MDNNTDVDMDNTGQLVTESFIASSVVDYDKELPDHMGALQRMELIIADERTMDVVSQRVIDGENLKQIAKSWKIPPLRFAAWVGMDDKRLSLYEGALRMRADELMHETLEIAGNSTSETVASDKLLVDTHMKLAAKWDRQRYGDEKAVGGAGITIVVNRGRYGDEVSVSADGRIAIEAETVSEAESEANG